MPRNFFNLILVIGVLSCCEFSTGNLSTTAPRNDILSTNLDDLTNQTHLSSSTILNTTKQTATTTVTTTAATTTVATTAATNTTSTTVLLQNRTQNSNSDVTILNGTTTLPTENKSLLKLLQANKAANKTLLISNNPNDISKNEHIKIIVYIPQDETKDLEQFNNKNEANFAKKFKNLFLSFLLFTLQGHNLDLEKEENETDLKEDSKNRSERDIHDFFKQIKDSVIDTSKTIVNTTKDVAKTVENNIKKVASRNVSFSNENVMDFHICPENCNDSTHTSQNAATTITTLSNTAHNEVDTTMHATEAKKPRLKLPLKLKVLINEHYTSANTSLGSIDQNTKYLFGEKHSDTADKTTITTIIDSHNLNKRDKIKARIIKKIERHINRKKCEENSGSACNNSHDKKKPDITNNTTSSVTHLSVTPMNITTKKLDTKGFLIYKDWLWQHLESIKNGSFKSNSTKGYLSDHHFLFNSGDTEKSVTDASEPFFIVALTGNENRKQHLNRTKRNTESKSFNYNDDQYQDVTLQEKNNYNNPDYYVPTEDANVSINIKRGLQSEDNTTFSPTEAEIFTSFLSTRLIQETRSNTTSLLMERKETGNRKDITIGNKIEISEKGAWVYTQGENTQHDFEKEWNFGGGIHTRRLLLLVTVPSFVGIGIFILVLCFLTRANGWCCSLCEIRHVSISTVKDPTDPSVSRRY